MRIVHWNTHHGGKRTDGTLDTNGLGWAIARLNPDVVCLNEVEQFDGYGNDDKVQTWANILGPAWQGWFANLSGVINGHGQGNAILARIADVTPGSFVAKPLFDARVAVALTVRGVVIVSTHLDEQKAENRDAEIVQLFAWDPVRLSPKLVIAADWNAVPSALELTPLRVFMKDAWLAPIHTSFNGTGNTKGHRIDAVFSRGLQAVSCDVPDTSINTVFPSDHHPVVTEFP